MVLPDPPRRPLNGSHPLSYPDIPERNRNCRRHPLDASPFPSHPLTLPAAPTHRPPLPPLISSVTLQRPTHRHQLLTVERTVHETLSLNVTVTVSVSAYHNECATVKHIPTLLCKSCGNPHRQ